MINLSEELKSRISIEDVVARYWEEQEPFGIVNNQNIDYYLEKATMKAEKEIKEQSNTETKQLKADMVEEVKE